MTTGIKDTADAVDKLLWEANQIRHTLTPDQLADSGWPGTPLLRPAEIAEYLERLESWVERQKGER